jgi:aldose sugar dehydrogenase
MLSIVPFVEKESQHLLLDGIMVLQNVLQVTCINQKHLSSRKIFVGLPDMHEDNKLNHESALSSGNEPSSIDMKIRKLILPALSLSFILVIVSPLLGWSQLASPPNNEPIIVDDDTNLAIEKYAGGMEFPSSMAFVGPDDILVLEKNSGQVRRIVNGAMLEAPLLEVPVAIKDERGLLGIAVTKDNQNGTTFVFLYYTESARHGDDLEGKDPLGNRLYRYELVSGKLVKGTLLLDLPAKGASHHNGGRIAIGPDGNIYLVVGDLQEPGQTPLSHITTAQNIANSLYPDGTSGILRVTQDGKPVDNILGGGYPLELYYAYGIRNSFGIDFDPVTGKLWDTENGPDFGDEINLVEPGFNSGWRRIQGMEEDPNRLNQLVQFPGLSARDDSLVGRLQQFWFEITGRGGGKYSNPAFVWLTPIAPTAIRFMHSDALGERYVNDAFVASFNTGYIYHFELNDNRTGFVLNGSLSDRVAEDFNDAEELAFAKNFGRITDMAIGPDGYLYVLTIHGVEGAIYRIVPAGNN